METEAVLKMDIFFFVTTVVVAVIGILVALLLYYLIKVVRNVRDITTILKTETEETVKDFREVRKNIKEGVRTARNYTKAAAGAGLLKALSGTIERFVHERMGEHDDAEGKTTTRRKKPAKDADV